MRIRQYCCHFNILSRFGQVASHAPYRGVKCGEHVQLHLPDFGGLDDCSGFVKKTVSLVACREGGNHRMGHEALIVSGLP